MGLFGKPNIEKLMAKKDVEELINALHHKKWKIKKEAAEALGKLKDTSAINPLINALDIDNEDVQKAVIKALGKIGTPAVESLITLLKNDEDWSARDDAAKALGEIKDKHAVEPLINALKHDTFGSVRYEAAIALGKIKDSRAIKPLEGALTARSYDLRVNAQTALQKITGKKYEEKPIIVMTEGEMVTKLRDLCAAYMEDNRSAIGNLEPIATKIGKELDRRGGLREMRRIFKKIEGSPGSRTLEMHWNRIGEWMG